MSSLPPPLPPPTGLQRPTVNLSRGGGSSPDGEITPYDEAVLNGEHVTQLRIYRIGNKIVSMPYIDSHGQQCNLPIGATGQITVCTVQGVPHIGLVTQTTPASTWAPEADDEIDMVLRAMAIDRGDIPATPVPAKPPEPPQPLGVKARRPSLFKPPG
jgi:hypothetical protein